MTLPNLLTVLRMLLSGWFGFEYCRGNTFLAFFIFSLAGISDVADGYIARRYGQVSSAGKLIDPLADKLMEAVGLWCLVYSGTINRWFLIVLLVNELFLVTGSIYMLGKGIVVHSSKYGKTAGVFFTAGIGSGILGFTHIAAGFLIGALCCSIFAAGYYTLYFSN